MIFLNTWAFLHASFEKLKTALKARKDFHIVITCHIKFESVSTPFWKTLLNLVTSFSTGPIYVQYASLYNLNLKTARENVCICHIYKTCSFITEQSIYITLLLVFQQCKAVTEILRLVLLVNNIKCSEAGKTISHYL